jgi:hypothetical protein
MTDPSLPRTFIIEYTIYFMNGQSERHTTKVKNVTNELFAKMKLETHLMKKHHGFDRMVVYGCREWSAADELFNGFKF